MPKHVEFTEAETLAMNNALALQKLCQNKSIPMEVFNLALANYTNVVALAAAGRKTRKPKSIIKRLLKK